ncbi:hypothetical protein [Citrobacter portucalensis]
MHELFDENMIAICRRH